MNSNKKRKMTRLATLCLGLAIQSLLYVTPAEAQTYTERLSRGVVALPTEKGNFVSWRFLATDNPLFLS